MISIWFQNVSRDKWNSKRYATKHKYPSAFIRPPLQFLTKVLKSFLTAFLLKHFGQRKHFVFEKLNFGTFQQHFEVNIYIAKYYKQKLPLKTASVFFVSILIPLFESCSLRGLGLKGKCMVGVRLECCPYLKWPWTKSMTPTVQ